MLLQHRYSSRLGANGYEILDLKVIECGNDQVVCRLLGDWNTALQYYKMNLELSEQQGDLWNLITAYNNTGIIEFGRGNFQTAAQYFERSVRLDEKIGALENEALARENLAEALEMLGRWNDALVQYNRCLSLQGFDETRASRTSVYIPLARLTNKRGRGK